MNGPSERVRRRVLSGQQHRHQVAVQDIVGERAAGLVDRREHRFEEVRWLGGTAGIVREPGSSVLDEALQPVANLGERTIEAAIGGAADETPRWEQREQSPVERRKNMFEPPLDDIVALLEGVDVVPEGEKRRDIDRESLQVVDDVEGTDRDGACRSQRPSNRDATVRSRG